MDTAKKTTKQQKRVLNELAMRAFFRLMWGRFSYERTPPRERKWLYELRDNTVSHGIQSPCCLGQVVTEISENATAPIRIHLLSVRLRSPVLSRGMVVVGSFWNEIDNIAHNYEHMQWWITEDGLTMDTIIPVAPSIQFHRIVGQLIAQMRQEVGEQSRFTHDQWRQIAAKLDSFNLAELLPRAPREELAEWNQKNGMSAIRTFSQALDAKRPKDLRRQALRVLYHADEKFKREQQRLMKLRP